MKKLVPVWAVSPLLLLCFSAEAIAAQDTTIDVTGKYAGAIDGVYLVSLGNNKQLQLSGGQSLTVTTTETGDNGIRLAVTPVLASAAESYAWVAGQTARTGRNPYAYHMAFYRGEERVSLLGEVVVSLTIPSGYENASFYYMSPKGELSPVRTQKEGNRLQFTIQNDGYYLFLLPLSSSGSGSSSDSSGSGSDSSGSDSGSSESSTSVDSVKGHMSQAEGIITGTTGSSASDGYSHWVLDNNGWRLRYANGTYAAGTVGGNGADGQTERYHWEKVNGGWYVFAADSYALFGWVYDSALGHWYYLDVNTGMKTGWYEDYQDGRWYYLDSTGAMVTGWRLIGGSWYYFNEYTPVQTWEYDGTNRTWQYLKDSQGRPYGSMYQNEVTPDGYRVDESGIRTGRE